MDEKLMYIAKILEVDTKKITKNIENKDNLLKNMIVDKVKNLQYKNKELEKSRILLADTVRRKDIELEEIKDIKEIKEDFDKIIIKATNHYTSRIEESEELINQLHKELDYYKKRVKELSKQSA